MAKITAQEIIATFDFALCNEEPPDLTREITYPGIHRLGLELAGVYESSHSTRQIIGWGTKEGKWLASLGATKARAALGQALVKTTPLLILSEGVKAPALRWIVALADELAIPVVQISFHLSDAISTVGWYLSNRLAAVTSVHGSLVIVYGIGVMIIGPSGIGKSEAVLELVQENHAFVSDDTVNVSKVGNQFIGRGAMITRGILESRGIGLVDIQHLYGAQVVKSEARVELVVELVPSGQMNELDRLGNQNLTYELLGGKLPRIQIPVNPGRSVSALIKAAVGVYIAKQDGSDTLKIMQTRMLEGETN